ncbi:MAG: AraC family transcriptional regulator [Clostridiales bacterium]|jgi:iron complex transport system substrate-binding protein|nr:AraC family transcriptional regulator [Clostridiales bacterium]
MIFPDCLAIKNISAVEILMRKMIGIYESEALGKELLLKAYLLELIHIVYTSLSEDYSVPNKASNFQRIKQAFDYINESYMKDISVQSLAALCNLSTNYFASLFKKQTGYSPMEYVIRVRIDNAKRLLLKNHSTISEIQQMVGFNDIHYFSFYFKKIERMSPSQYRHSVNP